MMMSDILCQSVISGHVLLLIKLIIVCKVNLETMTHH